MKSFPEQTTQVVGAVQVMRIPIANSVHDVANEAQHIVAAARHARGLVSARTVVSADRQTLLVILAWKDLEAMGNAALDLAPHLTGVSESVVDTDTSVFLPLTTNTISR